MSTGLARASVATLLRAAKRASIAIAADVTAATSEAVAMTSRKKSDDAERLTILLLLLRVANSLSEQLRKTIQAERASTRSSAIARLKAELTVAGVAGVTNAHWRGGSERYSEDDAQAAVSAGALATAWRGLAAYAAIKAIRRSDSVSRGLRQTQARMQARIKRMAVTETAQAYNDEHDRALQDAVEYDKTYRDGLFADEVGTLMREWSAIADACPICLPHDGEQVHIGDNFSGGDEPGFMHPHCRCIEIIVPASASVSRAA